MKKTDYLCARYAREGAKRLQHTSGGSDQNPENRDKFQADPIHDGQKMKEHPYDPSLKPTKCSEREPLHLERQRTTPNFRKQGLRFAGFSELLYFLR